MLRNELLLTATPSQSLSGGRYSLLRSLGLTTHSSFTSGSSTASLSLWSTQGTLPFISWDIHKKQINIIPRKEMDIQRKDEVRDIYSGAKLKEDTDKGAPHGKET